MFNHFGFFMGEKFHSVNNFIAIRNLFSKLGETFMIMVPNLFWGYL